MPIGLVDRVIEARRIARWRASNIRKRIDVRVDGLRGYPRLKGVFRRMVGYDLDLEAPRRYNEKIQWRKIRDRNPLFPIVGDKVGVRAYAAERLGRETAEAITIPHLFVADHPDRIPFDRLPDAYVIKASHASGWNLFVRDGQHPRSGPDRERLLEWVNREFGQNVYEWAYTRMPRRLVGEPFQAAEDGSFPDDLKFYMYDGRCHTIHHNVYGRQDTAFTPKMRKKVFMSPAWEKMDISSLTEPAGEPSPRPHGLARMLEIAEILSAGFDFVRVDFMALPDRFYLGEMTVYPSSGLKPLHPPEAEEDLGARWHLPVGAAGRG